MGPAELKARRQALGLSRRELATYLGVSPYTVRNWEQGNASIEYRDFMVRVALTAAENAARRGLPLPNWKELAL